MQDRIVYIGDDTEGGLPVGDEQRTGKPVVAKDGMPGWLFKVKRNVIGEPTLRVDQGAQVSHGFIQKEIPVGVGLHFKTPSIGQVQAQWGMPDLISLETLPAIDKQLQHALLGQVDGFILQSPTPDI